MTLQTSARSWFSIRTTTSRQLEGIRHVTALRTGYVSHEANRRRSCIQTLGCLPRAATQVWRRKQVSASRSALDVWLRGSIVRVREMRGPAARRAAGWLVATIAREARQRFVAITGLTLGEGMRQDVHTVQLQRVRAFVQRVVNARAPLGNVLRTNAPVFEVRQLLRRFLHLDRQRRHSVKDHLSLSFFSAASRGKDRAWRTCSVRGVVRVSSVSRFRVLRVSRGVSPSTCSVMMPRRTRLDTHLLSMRLRTTPPQPPFPSHPPTHPSDPSAPSAHPTTTTTPPHLPPSLLPRVRHRAQRNKRWSKAYTRKRALHNPNQ